MTHDAGVPEVKLPASNDDLALYLVAEGVAGLLAVGARAADPDVLFRETVRAYWPGASGRYT